MISATDWGPQVLANEAVTLGGHPPALNGGLKVGTAWPVLCRKSSRAAFYTQLHATIMNTYIYILFDDFDVNIVLHGSFFSSQNIATKRHICPCKAVSYEPLLGMLGHLQAAL